MCATFELTGERKINKQGSVFIVFGQHETLLLVVFVRATLVDGSVLRIRRRGNSALPRMLGCRMRLKYSKMHALLIVRVWVGTRGFAVTH